MVHAAEPHSSIRPHRLTSAGLYYPAAMVCIAIVILLLYYPITTFPFYRDDFGLLSASAAGTDHFWKTIMTPVNEHLNPLFRALLIADLKVFGLNPPGYYWVNITIHIFNAWLVFLLYQLLTSDKSGALCAGILFGVSAAYWRAVMWITGQCVLMSTSWFLVATLLFLLFLKYRSLWILILSSLSLFLMLLSFSAGVEVPLLYAVFIIFIYSSGHYGNESKTKLLLYLIPYAAVIGMYLLLRVCFVPDKVSIVSSIGGVTGFIHKLPVAARMLLGGIYQGYFRSFTGLYHIQLSKYYCFLVLCMTILLVNRSSSELKKRAPLMVCMALWLCISYFPPIFFRISEGYWEIVTKPRYRYLPAFAAVTLAVLLFRSFRPFTAQDSRRIGVYACWVLFVCIICANVSEIRRRERFVYERAHRFDIQVERFLAAFEKLSSSNPGSAFGVLNRPFCDEGTVFAGWNVYPSQVVKLYIPPESYSATRFVSQYKPERDFPLYMYDPRGFEEVKKD